MTTQFEISTFTGVIWKNKISKKDPKTISKIDSTYLSIITLHVNGLNAPIKRVAEWIQTQDQHICWLQETCLKYKHIGLKNWNKKHMSGARKRIQKN